MANHTDGELREQHKHDWKLMHISNITTRFKNAPPTRETIIDIVLDLGDRSERWRCVDCGEEKFFFDMPKPLENLSAIKQSLEEGEEETKS